MPCQSPFPPSPSLACRVDHPPLSLFSSKQNTQLLQRLKTPSPASLGPAENSNGHDSLLFDILRSTTVLRHSKVGVLSVAIIHFHHLLPCTALRCAASPPPYRPHRPSEPLPSEDHTGKLRCRTSDATYGVTGGALLSLRLGNPPLSCLTIPSWLLRPHLSPFRPPTKRVPTKASGACGKRVSHLHLAPTAWPGLHFNIRYPSTFSNLRPCPLPRSTLQRLRSSEHFGCDELPVNPSRLTRPSDGLFARKPGSIRRPESSYFA